MQPYQFIKCLNNLEKRSKDQYKTHQIQLKEAFIQSNIIIL